MITKEEFRAVIEDESKRIEGDIPWSEDVDHSDGRRRTSRFVEQRSDSELDSMSR